MAEKSLRDIKWESYKHMQDAIFNNLVKAADYKYQLKKLESRIDSLETFVSDHFESVHQEVNATYAKRKKVKAEEEITLINEEADEEIRLVNQKRDDRIKECLKKAEQQEDVISDDQQEIISEIEKILETIKKDVGLDEMKSRNTKNINDVDDIKCRICPENRPSVTENGQISATLEELSSAFHDQDTAAYMYLDKLQLEVQKVQFLGGQLNGEYYARIDGYVGKWELVKSVPISSDVYNVQRFSQITNDSVCWLSILNNVHVINISNGNSEKILYDVWSETSLLETGRRRSGYHFQTCVPLDSIIIVCGRRLIADRKMDIGPSEGCITVHDRQWKLVRDITLPKRTDDYRSGSGPLYFDVDKNGMILAAEIGQSKIYVINPVDGKIMDTITMQDSEVFNEIQALSSGDIALVEKSGLTLVSRSGEKKAPIRNCHDWDIPACHVDKLTDTIYITYRDEERGIYVVDQVSSGGKFEARSIVEYGEDVRYCPIIGCVITPSGNLLACSGQNILIYKKSFDLGVSARTRPAYVGKFDHICCCEGCLWNRATYSLD